MTFMTSRKKIVLLCAGIVLCNILTIRLFFYNQFLSDLSHGVMSDRINIRYLDANGYTFHFRYGNCSPSCTNFYIKKGWYTRKVKSIEDIRSIKMVIDNKEKAQEYISLLDAAELTTCRNDSSFSSEVSLEDGTYIFKRRKDCFGDPDTEIISKETISRSGEYTFSEDHEIRRGESLFPRAL